jgi:hypothetical protein
MRKYFVAYVLLIVIIGTGFAHAASPGAVFQYQLQGSITTSVNAQVFDVDGFDASSTAVSTLHALGKEVICYIDAGTWESWRPDAALFPTFIKGKSNGWPGEKWLDIRQLSTVQPLMLRRAQMCHDKGFDAIEWDNVDGYSNSTGFPLRASDQLAYNLWLAAQTHALGMHVYLKNDLEQAIQLQPAFDALLLEECATYNECSQASSFVRAGKYVVDVEYRSSCPSRRVAGITYILKTEDLNAWMKAC